MTTLQLGWWSVASLTFTRKCFLRASHADVGMAFSLAEDRGLSRSRFNRHSPGFVCSVLRIADTGMALNLISLTEACLAVASIGPLLVSIGTRLFRLLRASVRRCGNGFLFSQRPRPVSLWNEVPLTLIARRWPCAFFLSDS